MTMQTNPHNYPEHAEDFDVLMIKDGKSTQTATPEDYKRLRVEGVTSPYAAITHESVLGVKGYSAMFAVPPGVTTDPEVQAQRRTLEEEDAAARKAL